MSRRRSLGAWLAWWLGLATAVSLVVFAATAALVLWIEEATEDDDDDELDADEVGESESEFPADELLPQLGLAFAVATPVALMLAIAGARGLTRRATRRIDEVIATAARMSAEDLSERLPVAGVGDELDELAVALNALFGRLDAGIAAQRQFAADASHELRSPLTVLSSTLEVARRRPRSVDEWEGYADRALDEVRRMSGLVDALLQLARAGAGLRRVEVGLEGLLDGVADRWRDAATGAKVELRCEAADVRVRVDAAMLEIALGNLVANAIAYSPVDAVVTVRGRVDGEVEISIEDQGPGIPVADRERIFTPFVRVEAPAADRVAGRAGLGLGLAIARRIVEGHGGTLAVGEAPGGGARFSVRLPREGGVGR